MHSTIATYNNAQPPAAKQVCEVLAAAIDRSLAGAESKIWHRHPVWFLDGNPIVGYSTQKAGVRLMFWSGADFAEPGLNVVGKRFKDASIFYGEASAIEAAPLRRWLKKAKAIQWDLQEHRPQKGQAREGDLRLRSPIAGRRKVSTTGGTCATWPANARLTCRALDRGRRSVSGPARSRRRWALRRQRVRVCQTVAHDTPVAIAVEIHTNPTAASHVGRYEVASGVVAHEQVLRDVRRVAPDRVSAGTVVIGGVREAREHARAHPERGLAVRGLLRGLRESQRNPSEPRQRTSRHDQRDDPATGVRWVSTHRQRPSRRRYTSVTLPTRPPRSAGRESAR